MARFLRLSTLVVALVLAGVLQVLRPSLAFASFDCASSGDLNAAIDQANPGDVITISGTCAGTFTINKPLTLQGDPTFGGTVSRLLVAPGSGSVTLQHLTISGGGVTTAIPNGSDGLPLAGQQDGGAGGFGGLDIENGTVNVVDVTITGNHASSGGNGETVAIPKIKATVGGNGGRGGVGGVLVDGGTVTFSGVTVSDNEAGGGGAGAEGFSAGNGGNSGTAGVEVGGGTVTFENSQITDNGNGGGGGTSGLAYGGSYGGIGGDGVANAPGNGGHGGTGALYVRGGSVTLIASTISGNTGGWGGDGGQTLVNSTVGNGGNGGTGGIFMAGGTVGLYNTTVTGNNGGSFGDDGDIPAGFTFTLGNPGDGAAKVTNGSTITLVYSTVWGNIAGTGGGVLDMTTGFPGVVNGGGTITGTASIVQDCSGTFDDEGDNAVGDNSCVDPVNGPAAGTVVGRVNLQALKNGSNSTPLLPENKGSSSIGNIPQAQCDAGFPGPSGSGIPNPGGSGDLIFADQRGVSRAHRNCDAGSFQTLGTPTVDLLHDATDDTGISQTDDVTSNNRPTFKGQLVGGTGLTATIYDNGRSMGTAVIGGTLGNNDFFFIRPATVLSDGVHSITASVQDPDSGQSVISAPSAVTIETGVPNVFIVPKSQPFSSTGIYDPDAGGSTLGITTGVSDPGGVTALSCSDGSTSVASLSSASGVAQLTKDVTLTGGSHSISCTGTGAAGNHGSLTQTFFVKEASNIIASGITDHNGVTTLTADLSDDQGNGVNGKTITFYVKDSGGNWVQVCGVSGQPVCPLTQTVTTPSGSVVGQANLVGLTLPAGYSAGPSGTTYPGVVKANFGGDPQHAAADATSNLEVQLPNGQLAGGCPTTEAALQSDVNTAGFRGTVVLNCTHDTTIQFTSPISLTATTIFSLGPGRVIFDGGGQTQLFHVAAAPPNEGGEVSIKSVTLQNGLVSGTQGGGAVQVDSGATAIVAFDTFINNGPNDIANAGNALIAESTFSDTGAALYNTGTASLEASTLAGDPIFGLGNAAIVNTSGASLTLAGTIVANAATGRGVNCDIATDSSVTDNGYNLEWSGVGGTDTCRLTGGSDGPDTTGTDPLLGPLQYNTSSATPATMALLPGSPAIDRIPINTTVCVQGDDDERLVPRPQNGLCDIGAYEYINKTPPSFTNVAANASYNLGNPVSASFTATLRDATNAGLNGKIVVFSVSDGHGNWTPICGDPGQVDCPTTQTVNGVDGVATLDGIDLSTTYANADVNAGSYAGAVRAQFFGDTTGNGAEGTGDLGVAKAQNVVSLSFAALAPITYGMSPSSNPGIDLVHFSTHSAGAGITFASETTDVCTTSPGSTLVSIVSAGICTIQASAPGDTNHLDAVPVEAGFLVSPANLVVTASGGQMVAGQDPPAVTPTIDPSGFVNGDTAPTAVTGAPVCSTTATASSPAGDYPTICTQGTLGAANYTFQFVPGTLHVQQPTATITLDAATLNPVYDGNPRTVTATTNPAGLSYSVSYADANNNPIAPPTAPGVYTVTARITDPGQLALPVTGTLLLHKAVLQVTCDDQSMTSGEPLPTLTSKVTGFVGNDTSSVISGTPSCSTPATSSSPPGTYPIGADVSGLTATNYSIARGPDGTLTILQAVATITLDASTLSPMYDGGPHAVTATTTPSGLSYAVTYTGINGTTYGPSTTPPTGAGSYSVDASVTDTNYGASDATGTLTVKKQSTSISGVSGSGVYAGTATLVATLKDASGNGLAGKTIVFSVNGTSVCGGSNQPSCPTTADGSSGTVQGQATLSGASLAGVNAGTASGGVSASFSNDPNFANSAGTGDLSVGQASAKLALSNLSQAYSGSPEGATVTTSPPGLAGVSVTYTGTNGTTYPTSTSAPTNAGSYSVDASLSNANYTANDATGTLTINKADQTISIGTKAPSSAGYNSQITVAATAPGGAVTYGSSGACTNNGPTYTMAAGTGTCTVTFDQAGNGNYNPAKEVTETVTATKAQLTVTPNNQTVQYSDHLPTFTVQYGGFAPNDGPSSLNGSLSCSTAATVNSSGQVLSPVGTYAITCTGQSSANYAITYAGGTLTVTPENAVVKPAANNPADLQVTKAGGTAPQFTLGATITEASDGSYGDITKAGPITFSLTPIGGGTSYSCMVPSTSGSVTKVVAATATSPGSETVSCTFPAGKVGVNVYDVTVSVGGTYYTGSADGALTVFDMSQTGVQWGGGTVVNPVTGNTASVGFSASYNSSGGVVGKLIYVETDSKGNQTVLKGNNLATMAITKSGTGGYPETAIITGKGVLNGVGNYGFVLTAVDAAGGTAVDADKFGLQVKDPTGAQVPSLWYATAQPITSGNVFIK